MAEVMQQGLLATAKCKRVVSIHERVTELMSAAVRDTQVNNMSKPKPTVVGSCSFLKASAREPTTHEFYDTTRIRGQSCKSGAYY